MRMLYIRTDANKQIASGHVMRCLSIALELRKQGNETTFIVSEKDAADLIEKYQFPYILIKGAWDNLELELDDLIKLVQSCNIKKLLVDSYYASPEYFEILSYYTKLIYLGSLERSFTNVDLLINYSNIYNKDFYSSTYNLRKTQLLLGVQYAPLRDDFQQIKPCVRDRVENILITSGNTDADNIMEDLIRYIINDDIFKNMRFHVVVGTMNHNKTSLQLLETQYDNVILNFNVSSMSKLMVSCDLAISASGTTLYELCACGLPTVCFSITQEQIKGAVQFSEEGLLFYAGNVLSDREKCFGSVKRYSENLIHSYSLRKEMAVKMNSYVDGNGNKRIIKAINEL